MKEWEKRRKKSKHLLFGMENNVNHIFIADVKLRNRNAYWFPPIEAGFIQYILREITSCVCSVGIQNHLRG